MTVIRLIAVLICPVVLSGCAKVAATAPTPMIYGTPVCGCGEDDLVANVGDRVFSAFNASALSSDADAALHRQSVWLAKYPSVNILIAGNADERGTEAYNLALGQRRADAARAELVALGVAPSRIQTISYGKDCPVAAGNDDPSYQQNRNAITSMLGFNPQNCH